MSLARGAFIQLQVVHSVVLRETRTRFGDHQLGYLWALLEPIMWIATFALVYEVTYSRVSHGLELVPFLATGILTYELFIHNVSRTGESINGNKALLFYPQVQPIDLVIARAALETSTLTVVFAVVMLGTGIAHGELPRIDDLLRTMVGLGLASLLGASLGLLLCMLGVLSNVVERLRGPMMRPLFWTSGVFYTLDDTPSTARELLLYNPVLHTLEIVRDGWFPEYDSPAADPFYVLPFILVFAALGLLLERVVRRRIDLS